MTSSIAPLSQKKHGKNVRVFRLESTTDDSPFRTLVEITRGNRRGHDYNALSSIQNNNSIATRMMQDSEDEALASFTKDTAAHFGIFYDSIKYDYLQHLKPIGQHPDAVFIPAPGAKASVSNNKSNDLTNDIKRLTESVEVAPQDPATKEVLEALEDEAFVDKNLDDQWFNSLVNEDLVTTITTKQGHQKEKKDFACSAVDELNFSDLEIESFDEDTEEAFLLQGENDEDMSQEDCHSIDRYHLTHHPPQHVDGNTSDFYEDTDDDGRYTSTTFTTHSSSSSSIDNRDDYPDTFFRHKLNPPRMSKKELAMIHARETLESMRQVIKSGKIQEKESSDARERSGADSKPPIQYESPEDQEEEQKHQEELYETKIIASCVRTTGYSRKVTVQVEKPEFKRATKFYDDDENDGIRREVSIIRPSFEKVRVARVIKETDTKGIKSNSNAKDNSCINDSKVLPISISSTSTSTSMPSISQIDKMNLGVRRKKHETPEEKRARKQAAKQYQALYHGHGQVMLIEPIPVKGARN